jgi:hypothetical protein
LLGAATAPVYAHINEIQKLTASDGGPGHRFGAAVALDALTGVVGAPGFGPGSAYVFEAIPMSEQAKLFPSDGLAGDAFGSAVSVSGDTAVIGAPRRDDNGASSGAVYVYTRSGTVWTEEAKVLPLVGAADDSFGADVDISGDTLLVGAPGYDGVVSNGGAAYVFVRSGTVWSEQAILTGADASVGDELGKSVTIDGDTAVAGAPNDSDVMSGGGSAYVFDRTGTTWAQDTKLTNATVGVDDFYGTDVDLKGTRLVIGAPKDDDHVPDGGVVFVYDDIAGTWTLNIALITTFVTVAFAEAGSSVAVDGNAILGGAPKDLATKGQVYFWSASLAFKEDIMQATDAVPLDQFGGAVAVASCWTLTGSQHENELGADAGAVYLHALKHPQDVYCTSGTSASGCTPTIGAIGFASATAPFGFSLFTQNVEGAKDGMFYISVNGRQANSWGSGTSFQCVVPPVYRGGLQRGSGTSGACDGGFIQDWNALWCPTCPKPAKNPGPGGKVQAQFWYRDPFNTSNQTTSLTNAVEFELCP